MRTRAQPRGYVLIFVLVVLLALSLVVSSVYAQASVLRSASISNTHVQVAAMNASHGAMDALRGLRDLSLTPPNSGCDYANWDQYKNSCAPGTFSESAQMDGGVIIDHGILGTDGGFRNAGEGGGLQYSFVVFTTPQTLSRYTIRATGYGGNALNSLNLVTSIVELEVEVGENKFKCSNEYDCSGGK